MKRAMLLLAVLCMSVGTAAADYVNPPGWEGDPNFTHQSWSFDQGNALGVPVAADAGYVSPGVPTATQATGGWLNDLGSGRQGGWLFQGAYQGLLATFDLPNIWNPVFKKQLWFQITLKTNNFAILTDPNALKVGIDVKDDTGKSFDFTGVTFTPLGGDASGIWIRATGTFEIFPQPPFERMIISGALGANEILIADQVDIDTRCVPEPSTLILLVGAGLLGLVGYLRRK